MRAEHRAVNPWAGRHINPSGPIVVNNVCLKALTSQFEDDPAKRSGQECENVVDGCGEKDVRRVASGPPPDHVLRL